LVTVERLGQDGTITKAAIIRAIYAAIPQAGGSGKSYQFDLSKNGGNTTGCTIADLELTCNNTSLEVAIADDDNLATVVTPTSGPTNRHPSVSYLIDLKQRRRW
jgi:hypothetical protein